MSIDIGLYGEAAPESVALFRGLCGSGDLPPELRYRSSTCTRIEQGKSIVCGRLSAGSAARIDREIDATGYVRSSLVSLADQYTTSDANALSHDRAGLVSMKKGGGQFEFVVTPAANPALDETNVVIGEVIQGMDVLQELDSVPARRPSKDSEVGGLVWALGACARLRSPRETSKPNDSTRPNLPHDASPRPDFRPRRPDGVPTVDAIYFSAPCLALTCFTDDEGRYLSVAKAGGDPRARIDTNYRPLQKVKITDATLLR